MAAEELPSDFDIVILGTGLAESVVAAACSRVGQRVLHLDRRSHYAANWASFTFNGLLTWIEEQKEESKPEKIEDWSSLVEEGEGLIHLSNSDPASITNLQVFSYTSEEEEADEPNTIEEEKAAGEDAVKESSETESAGSKEEEDAGPAEEEEPAETEEEEPEADQPLASPPSSQSEPIRKKISHAQLVKEGRRFNIDLVSKLLFSRGTLVDLLIKSNVSRYAEFKNVTRILTYRHGNIEQVPCSRADVFASRQLSVVEKRKLMRFLTSCMEETEEQTAYNGRPYSEFLRDQQLGESLQHFLLHSIAMVTEDTPTEEGLASTRHFLRCLGRYGNTAFLFPVYGLGEIPQCFCRMSAVFGGIYCLRHSVHCLIVDKDTNRCKAVIDSRGQRISCSHVVLEDSYLDADRKQTATPPRYLSRAVLITDASVLPSDPDQQISMVTVPPATTGGPSVKMVELSSSTMTCIPGTYLVHLTCQSVASAHEDLSPLVTRIFRTTEPQDEDRRPSVLWCLYFNMADGSALEVEGHRVPSNVYVCSGPDGALGHEHTIRQAESIFQKILPEEEFCPPAPNPEDIIYDGDNASPGEDRAAVENGGNQEENQEMEGNQEENQEMEGNQEENQEMEGNQEENQEMEGNQEEIQEKEGNQENQEENGVNQ